MKIEKENKKRVFQLFFENTGGQTKYQIVFALSKAKAIRGITRIITKVKELHV